MLDSKSLPKPDEARSSPPKKPLSAAKVAANRNNSRRSTGPRTKQGKKNSSRNAIKHGLLLAKELLLSSGPGKENEAEFATLHAKLWRFHQPVGYEEERLVDELVSCDWLNKRARRCEKGAVTLANEIPHKNLELTEDEQLSLNAKPSDEARYDLLQSSRGIVHLIRAIDYILQAMPSGGEIWSEAPEWLLPKGVWKGNVGLDARTETLKTEGARLKMLRVQVEQEEAEKEKLPA